MPYTPPPNIPNAGLAFFEGLDSIQQRNAERQEKQQLQQHRALQIQQAMQQQAAQQQAQQRAERVRQAIANSGGDPERAMQEALKLGDVDTAKALEPLVGQVQKRREREETQRGMRELFSPPPQPQQNPMIPGPGASVMAGGGTTTQAPAPVSPDAQKQANLQRLQKMAVMYANNPTILAQIQRQMAELEKPQPQTAVPEIVRLQQHLATLPPGDPHREPIEKRIKLLSERQQQMAPAAPTVVEVADPQDPTKSIKIDAKTGTKIGDAPPKPKVERALPSPLQKQLTASAEIADATTRFVDTFKDEYGGYKLGAVGDAVNWAKKTFGDDSGQAQWWQDYELHQSVVRNKLFGSALTAPEIAAWNKSAINPGMAPSEIRKNLARRAQIEKSGIDRLMKGAAAGGYSKEQIEAFTGRPLPTSEPAPAQAPRVIDFGSLQ